MPLVVAGMDGARTVVGPGPHFYTVVAGSTGAVVGVEVFCVVVQLHTAGVLDESGFDAFLLRFMPGLTESQPRDKPAAQTTRRAVAVGGANHSFLAFAEGLTADLGTQDRAPRSEVRLCCQTVGRQPRSWPFAGEGTSCQIPSA